ncbi:HlyD family secretion protein [Chitinimonas koreensis]|uniref:HlyD family secretion protein n=1 Tax=Chitinimonas koreensis TaxID=356302 RepID=UPI00040D152F|nr:HlyD family efflux transporter periplasmic adaptor subunit [Chitinimonas koreensis]
MRIEWMAPALLLALAGCGRDEPAAWHGYVEAEPVRLAAPVGGRLAALAVERGDTVAAGQPLFRLEQDSERAAVGEAAARAEQARAQADDLASGKRPDELAVTAAGLAAAQAALKQSESDLRRQGELARAGFVSGAHLDALRARRDADAAKVTEMAAQLRAGRLAGREASRAAAQAGTAAAEAQLAQRQWTLAQKTVAAPLAARVEERYYRVGEWVPAGSPVLSLLAPGAVKARFWVPEPARARLRPGSRVNLACDGCGAPVAATVRYVAREAEFTPPLIYSKENRAKLVFLAEATPLAAADAARLPPGLPLDVTPAAAP